MLRTDRYTQRRKRKRRKWRAKTHFAQMAYSTVDHAEQELYKKPFSIAPKPTPKPKRLGARQYAEVKQAEQKETMKKFKPILFRSNFPTHR